jgi:hypothetical protein
VFSAMLTTKGMKEAEEGRVEIDDIQPDVLRGLVEFFAYKGQVCPVYICSKIESIFRWRI